MGGIGAPTMPGSDHLLGKVTGFLGFAERSVTKPKAEKIKAPVTASAVEEATVESTVVSSVGKVRRMAETASGIEMYHHGDNIEQLITQYDVRLEFDDPSHPNFKDKNSTLEHYKNQQTRRLFSYLTASFKGEFELPKNVNEIISTMGNQRLEESEGGNDDVSRILRMAVLIRERNYHQYLIQKRSQKANSKELRIYEKKIGELAEADREKFQPEKFFIKDFGMEVDLGTEANMDVVRDQEMMKLIEGVTNKIERVYQEGFVLYQEKYQSEINERSRKEKINADLLWLKAELRTKLLASDNGRKIGEDQAEEILNDIIILL